MNPPLSWYLRGLLDINSVADAVAVPKIWKHYLRSEVARWLLDHTWIGPAIRFELSIRSSVAHARAIKAEAYCLYHGTDTRNCPADGVHDDSEPPVLREVPPNPLVTMTPEQIANYIPATVDELVRLREETSKLSDELQSVKNNREHYKQMFEGSCEQVAAMCELLGSKGSEYVNDVWRLRELVDKLVIRPDVISLLKSARDWFAERDVDGRKVPGQSDGESMSHEQLRNAIDRIIGDR